MTVKAKLQVSHTFQNTEMGRSLINICPGKNERLRGTSMSILYKTERKNVVIPHIYGTRGI